MTRDEFKEALAIAGEKYKTDEAVLRKRAKKQKVLKISIACAAGVFALAAVTAVMLLKRPKTPAANSGNDILLGIEPTQRPEETAEPVNDQPGEAGHESVGDDEHGYPAASASIYGSLANSASIEFNSFDDLQKALNLQNENTLYSYFSGRGIESKQIDNVQIFVNTIRMRNNIVPYLDGDKIELRNEDGFGNITLYSAEKYGLPCVFIHPKVSNGDNLYITITCIPEDFLGGQEPITASELISKMAPNYPNIDNFGSHCKNVYNTAVSLRDREVNALVYEYKNSNRNSTRFVYDNLLVEVRNDPKVWGEEWFSALSFGGF